MRPSDLDRVPALLEERGTTLGKPFHLIEQTTSTNDEAKRAAKAGAPHGAIWLAESQTAGRGRQGRAWISPPGENLLFSVLLRLVVLPSRLPPLSLVAGLCVYNVLARELGAGRVGLKWPNDVLVDGKKVAGVLVEAMLSGSRVDALVVGIGLNVHTRNFPNEIAETATSVALAAERPPDRATLLADIVAEVDRNMPHCAARGLGIVHARLSDADALRGKAIASEQGGGVAEGIDVEGRLLVRGVDGTVMRWTAGEVHLATR